MVQNKPNLTNFVFFWGIWNDIYSTIFVKYKTTMKNKPDLTIKVYSSHES